MKSVVSEVTSIILFVLDYHQITFDRELSIESGLKFIDESTQFIKNTKETGSVTHNGPVITTSWTNRIMGGSSKEKWLICVSNLEVNIGFAQESRSIT